MCACSGGLQSNSKFVHCLSVIWVFTARILCFASNYNSNPVQCAFLHETFQSSLFIWQDQMLKLTVQPEFGGKRQFQDNRPKNIFDKSARGNILF